MKLTILLVLIFSSQIAFASEKFTKISAIGAELPDNATQWSCVKHNITGQIWEVKTTANSAGTYTFDTAANYVTQVNANKLCGFSDWRVPAVKELVSIGDQTKYNPAIDTNYFKHINSAFYWTSTTSANTTTSAWAVQFSKGTPNSREKTSAWNVILVRGTSSFDSFNYTKLDESGNGLGASATNWACVRDNSNGLIWEVKTTQNKDDTYTFNTASSYLTQINNQGLCGISNWRIPSAQELTSLVDYNQILPAISTSYFPNTTCCHAFWSNNTDAYLVDYGLIVSFDAGSWTNKSKTDSYSVRLVQGNIAAVSTPTPTPEIVLAPYEGDTNHISYFLLEIGKTMNIDVSVDYSTRDGTATAGQDYISTSGTATIKAGKTSTVINVEIIGDTVSESDESFMLAIYNPKGAAFPSGITEITRCRSIINDDGVFSGQVSNADWSCNGGDVANNFVIPLVTLFSDPEDSKLFTMETTDNEKLTVFGSKDASGNASTLNAIFYQNNEQILSGEYTKIHFDVSNQILSIEGEDGMTIAFDRVNDSQFLLRGSSPNTENEVNTIIELSDLISSQAQRAALNSTILRDTNLVESLANIKADFESNSRLTTSEALALEVKAYVTQCGEHVPNAYVYFNVNKIPGFGEPDNNTLTNPVLAKEADRAYIGKLTTIPHETTKEELAALCRKATSVADLACPFSAALVTTPIFTCAYLSLYVLNPIFTGACVVGLEGAAVYCSVKDKIEKFGVDICKGIAETKQTLVTGQYEIQAVAALPGLGTKYSEKIIVTPSTTSAELIPFEFDFGNSGANIAIRSVTSDPPNPLPGQYYNLMVDTSCSVNSEATINVKGSDGFSQTKEHHLSTDLPFEIYVPPRTNVDGNTIVDTIDVDLTLSLPGVTTPVNVHKQTFVTLKKPVVEVSCDINHLNLCSTGISCSASGGYWYNHDSTCNRAEVCPNMTYLAAYKTIEECKKVSFYYYTLPLEGDIFRCCRY